MNSEERRTGRYHRRKAKREEKRLSTLDKYNFEAVADLDNLYNAMKKARKGVMWKASVQRYDMNYLRRILQARNDLLSGKDIRKGFYEFYTVERGKKRHIQSVHVTERVIQKSFCTHGITPHLQRTLIHDNGASLKGKGMHFTIKRLKTHLMKHYRQHGRNGHVLLIDYSNYFANIRHEPLLDICSRAFGEDKRLYWLAELFIKAFGEKGLGLGSEICQISAVAYTNDIDHCVTEVLKLIYAHYMDDSYTFTPDSDTAHNTLEKLQVWFDRLGIETRSEKVRVVKLSRGFTFLKAKFSLTETGKIIIRPGRVSITRQRRKLKKFKRLYDSGEMTLREIRAGYMAWRGYISHFDSYRTVQNMDKLYLQLFKVHPLTKV